MGNKTYNAILLFIMLEYIATEIQKLILDS